MLNGTARSALVVLTKGPSTEYSLASTRRDAISDQPAAGSDQLTPVCDTAWRFQPAISAPLCGQPQGLPLQMQRPRVTRRNQYHVCPAFVGAVREPPARPFALAPHPPVVERGFSASFRPPPLPGECNIVQRAASTIFTTGEIRGKAAPRRMSGAVLFGPFSLARKKKDEEK